MKRITYPTNDGGAIDKKDNVSTTLELEESLELNEYIPDGINIHITGTDLDKIGNVDINIYMKEEE